MTFNNNASGVQFIGNRQLEDVIAADMQELEKIGGSFEAIALRMRYFQNFCYNDEGETDYMLDGFGSRINISKPDQTFLMDIFDCSSGITHQFASQEYEVDRLIENKYRVWDISIMNGLQWCPFTSDCREYGGCDVVVANMQTNRVLLLNDITIHLVDGHSLLEKENAYGISAKEFYEEFM